jgi:putative endonuclease
MFKRRKGNAGEQKAAAFLKKEGYQIIEKNYRTPFGEIDIIALQNETLVFIEVKSRSSRQFGTGAESVDRRKQYKIIKSAQVYIKKFYQHEQKCRFDVISIDSGKISHIKNAFTL